MKSVSRGGVVAWALALLGCVGGWGFKPQAQELFAPVGSTVGTFDTFTHYRDDSLRTFPHPDGHLPGVAAPPGMALMPDDRVAILLDDMVYDGRLLLEPLPGIYTFAVWPDPADDFLVCEVSGELRLAPG
jgi:hypothetical protein